MRFVSPYNHFLLAQVLSLQGSREGVRYDITCRVSKGDRSSSSTGYLVVRSSPALPVVSVDGLAEDKVNPNSTLVLRGSVVSLFPDTLRTEWVQTAGPQPPLDLADPNVASTPRESTSLVLRPGVLAPGEAYAFAMRARDSGGAAQAEVPVPVARVPYGNRGAAPSGTPIGSLVARLDAGAGSPTTAALGGVAFVTVFSLSAEGWVDEDGPLQFQFQYVLNGQTATAVLAPFQPSPLLQGVVLPAGFDFRENNVTLQLLVQNRYGAIGGPAETTLRITLPSLEEPTQRTSFVATISEGAQQARMPHSFAESFEHSLLERARSKRRRLKNEHTPPQALARGSPNTALALAAGAATVLNRFAAMADAEEANGGAAADPEEFAARVAFREALTVLIAQITTVGVPTERKIEAVAAAMAAVVALPPEVSRNAQAIALDILSDIAGSGALVSAAAAGSVAVALSSIVDAVTDSLELPMLPEFGGGGLESVGPPPPAAAGMPPAPYPPSPPPPSAPQPDSPSTPSYLPPSPPPSPPAAPLPPAPRLGDQSSRRHLSRSLAEIAASPLDGAAPPGSPSPERADRRLRRVMDIVGVLASSLAQSISVPGEDAVVVSAKAIHLRVQVNSPAPDAARTGASLEGVNFTAPDSKAAFSPLPTAALAALDVLSTGGGGVAVQFATTVFDPYVASPRGVGITRLAFFEPQSGEPLPLENLQGAPIVFTLPAEPVPLNGGDGAGKTQGVCGFWSETERRYRCMRALTTKTTSECIFALLCHLCSLGCLVIPSFTAPPAAPAFPRRGLAAMRSRGQT